MPALRFAQTSPALGTTAFVFDGNRIYAELGFVRPDGSIHRALAYMDMGSSSMTLRESLFKELQLDRNRPLTFKVGDFSVVVPRSDIVSERRDPSSIGSDLTVEAMLSAGVLKGFQVVIDYRQRTVALAQPGTLKPEGVAVPFHINPKTGLIAIDASIDDTSYPVTIDNGSAYTWFNQTTATKWLVAHPDWARGVGAVGASNMMMSGDRTETAGTLIGGNVLKQFRLTIDYPNRLTYWLEQRDPESHDLDQVGLPLQSERGVYIVAAVATKNGKPTVDGVLPGDELVRVGDLELANATWGAIYNAMHGAPGEPRTLTLDRKGTRLTVVARVTAF